MIHHVTTKRATYWQYAPKVGLLLFVLLCVTGLPTVMQPVRLVNTLQDATQRALRQIKDAELLAAPALPVPATPDATRQQRQRTWRTITGIEVAEAKVFVRPTTDLPRSPYGDATWSPITDKITFEPFVKPTIGYFTGTLITPSTKAAFNTAVGTSAVDQDIVQISASLTWIRNQVGGGPSTAEARFRSRGTNGHVLIRDAAFASLPAQGVRVSAADLVTANYQYVEANDSLWDFAQATRGWYFRGLVLENTYYVSGVGDNSCILKIYPTTVTGGSATSIANTPRYITIEQCYVTNAWQDGMANARTRCGIHPAVEYGIICENVISGIASTGNECKAINTSNAIGKISVTNNDCEAVTETIMWGGAAVAGDLTEVSADIHMSRNYLHRRAEWLVATVSGSEFTGQKNFMEMKQGSRMIWERNYCFGFSGDGDPHCINIKHSCPGGAGDVGRVLCKNILARYNIYQYGAAPVACSSTTSSQWTPDGTQRVEVYGNLWYDDIPSFNPNGSNDRTLCSALVTSTGKTVYDFYFHHNTYNARQATWTFGGNLSQNTNSMIGLRLINNVDYLRVPHNITGPRSNDKVGVALLNVLAGAGGWLWAGNVTCGTAGREWGGVPGNYDGVASSALNFVNEATGNYELVSYAAYPGTDGAAPGVPMQHLTTMTTGVISGAAE